MIIGIALSTELTLRDGKQAHKQWVRCLLEVMIYGDRSILPAQVLVLIC